MRQQPLMMSRVVVRRSLYKHTHTNILLLCDVFAQRWMLGGMCEYVHHPTDVAVHTSPCHANEYINNYRFAPVRRTQLLCTRERACATAWQKRRAQFVTAWLTGWMDACRVWDVCVYGMVWAMKHAVSCVCVCGVRSSISTQSLSVCCVCKCQATHASSSRVRMFLS